VKQGTLTSGGEYDLRVMFSGDDIRRDMPKVADLNNFLMGAEASDRDRSYPRTTLVVPMSATPHVRMTLTFYLSTATASRRSAS
jgi:hypothetical protein